ncbi:signal peptide peptidase SppA [Gemmatimonas sp.]|uniref:signal peptide peptidase SppA n=1 Tax=Gemmatimonas sp. TaxID=1962908 RepID=UPI0025B9895F|nr:signal peptide peptidase SppA [Gemmatimonas sp.]MCA2991121.1 signal peptide peptidase SppA [Gemmatimonas sp.]
MKQFFAALAANLVTIAVCVVVGLLLIAGIAASAGSRPATEVRQGAVLVIDLDRPLSDQPAHPERRGFFDDAFEAGGSALPLRSALVGVRAAIDDDRISGILLRGTVTGDGTRSGYAALRALREALVAFAAKKKPVHAYLVNPDAATYYVASAASTITLDPFGSLLLPGLVSEQLFLTGLFEKYGIGVQVSRVGRFKAAVEPFTRRDMSPENRQQVASYLGDLWSEVKRGIARTRGVDTLALQALVDAQGIIAPAEAQSARLVDRVAYFDVVLTDLQKMAGVAPADSGSAVAGGADSSRAARLAAALDQPTLPQITLDDYAPLAVAKERLVGASQAIAIMYAEGDIVDGEGGAGQIGGMSFSRELRALRNDRTIKAVVLRVNSPGGSAVASEQIQRELTLMAQVKPVVVSMGSLAASGGYWISTAAARIYAEPNTITGSIGVFALVPNIQALANRHGVTFDTVKTGRYADLFTLARPRTEAELAVLQRGTDMVYDAFLQRVSTARRLPLDSVRALAEGRVWSGVQAHRLGLVDSLGSLQDAVKAAAARAKLTGDYDVREYPHVKTTTERLSELLEDKPTPVAAQLDAAVQQLGARGAAAELVRDITRELGALMAYNDPRGVYARMPFILRVR